MNLVALLLASIVFLPMDDRPVTYALPVMLGRIAGVKVAAPPRELAGNFLVAGHPDALIAWLNHNRRARTTGRVRDLDRHAGLRRARSPRAFPGRTTPTPTRDFASSRICAKSIRDSWIGAFGTIMRLAPTGIPAGTPYFAAYPTWSYLQEYANLHDPPLPSEEATSAAPARADRRSRRSMRISRRARAISRSTGCC